MRFDGLLHKYSITPNLRVGSCVGNEVGLFDVGFSVGVPLGLLVGDPVGMRVGSACVGDADGVFVGG